MTLSRSSISLRGFFWQDMQILTGVKYVCGFCGSQVASENGYFAKVLDGSRAWTIRICPYCHAPTLMAPNERDWFPGTLPGQPISNVPVELGRLYDEVRSCIAEGAYTGAVLICRKVLMHIAVEKGAQPGKPFVDYVNYLLEKGYVSPDGKVWVDHIRSLGNEANHEIKLMGKDEADLLMGFIEWLLRSIYEFPSKVPVKTTNPTS